MAEEPLTSSPLRISTTFHPHARHTQHKDPDFVLVSSDGVRFHVHLTVLLAASANSFAEILAPTLASSSLEEATVIEVAATLNLVLHTAYGLSAHHFAPNIETLINALTAVRTRYAFISPPYLTSSACSLFSLLVSHAIRGGIEGAKQIYGIAAQQRIEPLAIVASEQLLSLDIASITDEWSILIGGMYLRRIVMLLLNRTERLRRLIAIPPGPLHASRTGCGPMEQQRDVLRPWALAAATLVVEARANFPPLAIQSALNPVIYRCACAECRDIIQARIGQIVQEWNAEKRTI